MPNGRDHYDPWTERIKALGSLEGFLRYLVYAVIIILQLRNGGKVDSVATEAAVVKQDTAEIKHAALSTNAINTKWEAGRTGDPEDMAKAAKAEEKVMKQEAAAK